MCPSTGGQGGKQGSACQEGSEAESRGRQTDWCVPSRIWSSETLPYLEFWVPRFPRALHSLQVPWLVDGVDAPGKNGCAFSSWGNLWSHRPSKLRSPDPLARSLPTAQTLTRLSINRGEDLECLSEASWACATKKLLDAKGHLEGPAESHAGF